VVAEIMLDENQLLKKSGQECAFRSIVITESGGR